jgi:hypothetical protein
MNGVFPAGYQLRKLICNKRWVLSREIEKLNDARCSSGEWKAHKDGVHPEILEKRHKERMIIIRWTIVTILTVIVLGLIIYIVIFRK